MPGVNASPTARELEDALDEEAKTRLAPILSHPASAQATNSPRLAIAEKLKAIENEARFNGNDAIAEALRVIGEANGFGGRKALRLAAAVVQEWDTILGAEQMAAPAEWPR